MVYKIVLSLLLVLFQVGDVLLTEKILKHGGIEHNPLIKRYGYWIKIPVTVFAIAVGFLVHPIVLVPAVILQVGVCVWNYIVLRRLKNAK